MSGSTFGLILALSLMLSTLGKIFNRQHIEIFFFSQKVGFDITSGDNLQEMSILFSGKYKKNSVSLLPAEYDKRNEPVTG